MVNAGVETRLVFEAGGTDIARCDLDGHFASAVAADTLLFIFSLRG